MSPCVKMALPHWTTGKAFPALIWSVGMSRDLAFKVLGVCAIDMRESGSMVLPIVGGCNLFKFIISAVTDFSAGEVCVCVCTRLLLNIYCTTCFRLLSMGKIHPSPHFYGNTPLCRMGVIQAFRAQAACVQAHTHTRTHTHCTISPLLKLCR